MMKFKFDISEFRSSLERIKITTRTALVLDAVEQGSHVVRNAYIDLARKHATSSGDIRKFPHLYSAITSKVETFKSGDGAYFVVGVKTGGTDWRPLAPQGIWMESGADGHTQKPNKGQRYQYTTLRPTGILKAHHLLQQAYNATKLQAMQRCNAVLKAGLQRELA